MDGGMYVSIFYHIDITNHRQLDKLIHHYIYLIDLLQSILELPSIP